MARLNQVLTIPRFAEDEEIAQTLTTKMPPNSVVSRETGFDQSFSQVGGKRPDYRIFNQLLFELTSFFNQANKEGVPFAWSPLIDYVDPAFVKGRDGRIYISTENSGPATADAIDPVNDERHTRWDVY